MPKPSNRHSDLHTLLTQLSLTRMAEIFADVALRAAKEGLSHEAYLYELARQEEELRTQRRTARRLASVWVASRENLSNAFAQSTFSHLAIAIGAPKKCHVSGIGNQCDCDWQTWRGKKSLLSSGQFCAHRGWLSHLLDAHQRTGSATSGRQAGSAPAPGTGKVRQIRVRDSR
jgi:hypothetical protein